VDDVAQKRRAERSRGGYEASEAFVQGGGSQVWGNIREHILCFHRGKNQGKKQMNKAPRPTGRVGKGAGEDREGKNEKRIERKSSLKNKGEERNFVSRKSFSSKERGVGRTGTAASRARPPVWAGSWEKARDLG